MITFDERPDFETAWNATSFRVVMGGMGDDTAMLLAEMYARGFEPDEIVFCDTGSEFRHTYEFIDHLTKWCAERNWSKVTILKKTDKHGAPLSVIEVAERDNTLPSAAFGSKSCSMRFKIETADAYFNNHPKCWEAWGANRKGTRLNSHTGQILRIVGINADEPDRAANWQPEHKWVQAFPLFDWGIGEKESKAVEQVGLYYPGKSSCICCPHLTGKELKIMATYYPEDFQRIKVMEANYQRDKMKDDSGPRGMCRTKTIDQMVERFEKTGQSISIGSCKRCELQ